MEISKIFSLEERTEENIYKIYLVSEGNFFRAHEWSAFLCRNFPNELPEDKRLKPTKTEIKRGDYKGNFLVRVGFPQPSFEKYFFNLEDNQDLFKMEGKLITIDSAQFFKNSSIDFENYKESLTEWKNSIDVKQSSIKNPFSENNNVIINDNISNSIDLLWKIAQFPVEEKTYIEIMQFISNIKQQSINLLKNNK